MRRSTPHHPGFTTQCLAVLAIAMLGGCQASPEPIAYDLTIEPVEGLPVLTVDMIGVTASELPIWEEMSMTRYWTRGTDENQRRVDNINAGYMFSHALAAGQIDPVELPADEEIWQRWLDRGATHLVVMSNLEADEDRPGSADRRRRILPLAEDTWDGEQLRVQLRSSGFTVLTREQPR